jgi:hypothetical protein
MRAAAGLDPAFARADLAFHLALADASGNVFMQGEIGPREGRIEPGRGPHVRHAGVEPVEIGERSAPVR